MLFRLSVAALLAAFNVTYGNYSATCPLVFTAATLEQQYPGNTDTPFEVVGTWGPTDVYKSEGYMMNKILMVFKGIYGWQEFNATLSPFLGIGCNSTCKAHTGALEAWAEVKTATNDMEAIKSNQGDLIFSSTGHGFGGMIAQVAALDLKYRGFAYSCQSFGAPPVFNNATAAVYNSLFTGDSSQRTVANNDSIPTTIPVGDGSEYTFVETGIYGVDFNVCEDSPEDAECTGGTTEADHEWYFTDRGTCGSSWNETFNATLNAAVLASDSSAFVATATAPLPFDPITSLPNSTSSSSATRSTITFTTTDDSSNPSSTTTATASTAGQTDGGSGTSSNSGAHSSGTKLWFTGTLAIAWLLVDQVFTKPEGYWVIQDAVFITLHALICIMSLAGCLARKVKGNYWMFTTRDGKYVPNTSVTTQVMFAFYSVFYIASVATNDLQRPTATAYFIYVVGYVGLGLAIHVATLYALSPTLSLPTTRHRPGYQRIGPHTLNAIMISLAVAFVLSILVARVFIVIAHKAMTDALAIIDAKLEEAEETNAPISSLLSIVPDFEVFVQKGKVDGRTELIAKPATAASRSRTGPQREEVHEKYKSVTKMRRIISTQLVVTVLMLFAFTGVVGGILPSSLDLSAEIIGRLSHSKHMAWMVFRLALDRRRARQRARFQFGLVARAFYLATAGATTFYVKGVKQAKALVTRIEQDEEEERRTAPSTLGVTRGTNIRQLSVVVGGLDGAKHVVKLLRATPTLVVLDLDVRRVSYPTSEASVLLSAAEVAMARLTSLKELRYSCLYVDATVFMRILIPLKDLEVLSISSSGWIKQDSPLVVPIDLSHLKHLRISVDRSWSVFPDNLFHALATSSKTGLQVLDLGSTPYSLLSEKVLDRLLPHVTNITSFTWTLPSSYYSIENSFALTRTASP
ncbi:hypothetical protein RQP46_004317 [Phenoliferia psychrophenolica]